MKRRSSVEGRELRKTNQIFKKLTSAEPSGLFGGLSIRRAEHGIGAGVAEAQRGLLLLRCPSRRSDESWRLHRSSLIFFVKNLTTAVSFFSSFRNFSLFLFHSLSTQASPCTRRCGESSLRACCKWENASTSLDLSCASKKREIREGGERERSLSACGKEGALRLGVCRHRFRALLDLLAAFSVGSSLLASSSPCLIEKAPHLFSWSFFPISRRTTVLILSISKDKSRKRSAPQKAGARVSFFFFFFEINPLPSFEKGERRSFSAPSSKKQDGPRRASRRPAGSAAARGR